jgi:hypothetical protein
MELNPGRNIFGHMIWSIKLCHWKTGYEISECNHRNWITYDFDLWLGFVHVSGWLPNYKPQTSNS